MHPVQELFNELIAHNTSLDPISVTIGGLPANVLFAGIVAAGQFQLNVVVPNVPSGDQPLQITVDNAQTPAVFIAIQ